MQCTPVYYHARDSGYAYGEERGRSISTPLSDKEVLKQIIKNHDATFRYQVQELHRLYRRQRDLMDEMSMGEIVAHNLLSRTSESIHSLSPAGADFSQNPSPATNWLFGNLASGSKLSELTSGQVRGHTSSNNGVQFLSPSCNRNGDGIIDLELQADVYCDQRRQFKVGNISQAPDEIAIMQPASDSDLGLVKTRDSSSSSSNIRRTNCFIDLNIPAQVEPSPTSWYGPLEAFTGHNQTVCSEECVPNKAIPESVAPTHPQLPKSDDGVIDLNSMPVNCFSETEMTLESPCNHNRMSECYLCPSGSTVQIKPVEETELKGPVSPENEESSPPRGKLTPLSSEQGEGEPFVEEVDTIAAQTLVEIFSSTESAALKPLPNFSNLSWFAHFVSSTGDDVDKFKGTGTMSQKKGQKRGKKQHKALTSLTSLSKETSPLKRKAGRNGSAKARRHSSESERSTLKRWGTIRKRQGGRRCRASHSLASF